VVGAVPSEYIVVSIAEQKLFLVHAGRAIAKYPAGTSKYGIGNREGSNKTPRGVHRIVERIGGGAPLGRVFRDRIDTGETWTPGMPADSLVLTRILRLEGLEDGVNRGPGIDSYERYIYIHGTGREELVGREPLSHGCVCLRNADVAELYDKVKEGTVVAID
jgi:UDP-N-acetylmuramate--alanine ligase